MLALISRSPNGGKDDSLPEWGFLAMDDKDAKESVADEREKQWCPTCKHFRRVYKYEELSGGLYNSKEMIERKYLPCRVPEATSDVWKAFFSSQPRQLFPTGCDKWSKSPHPKTPSYSNPWYTVGGIAILGAIVLAIVFAGKGWSWLKVHTAIPDVVAIVLNALSAIRSLVVGIVLVVSVLAGVVGYIIRRLRKR